MRVESIRKRTYGGREDKLSDAKKTKRQENDMD